MNFNRRRIGPFYKATEDQRERTTLGRDSYFTMHEVTIAYDIMVKSLSEPEYQQLLAAIETGLITARATDRVGIEQRLRELQFYWADREVRGITIHSIERIGEKERLIQAACT